MTIPESKIQAARQTNVLELNPTELKKVSTHNGGEWAGPCPFCGGTDRFRVWPTSGRWWCRQCQRKGDQVALVMELDGVTFQEAINSLAGGDFILDRPDVPERDNGTWTARASEFLQYARDKLAPDGVGYLRTRGLDEITAWGAGLGWNPNPVNDHGEKWGLSGQVHLSPGLVIPHEYEGHITAINIRTNRGYRIVKGSQLRMDGQRIIYKPSPWPVKGKVILFEGELDALAAWQSLTDPTLGIGAIPAGNLTQLPDHETWVCFDNDQAGWDASDKAAQLGARVIHVPKQYQDFSDYHKAAGDSEARAFLYCEVNK